MPMQIKRLQYFVGFVDSGYRFRGHNERSTVDAISASSLIGSLKTLSNLQNAVHNDRVDAFIPLYLRGN